MSAAIRGIAELVADPEEELPKKLSHKYLHEDPPPESDEISRLVVRVIPQRVITTAV
jgi:hypothetical protein